MCRSRSRHGWLLLLLLLPLGLMAQDRDKAARLEMARQRVQAATQTARLQQLSDSLQDLATQQKAEALAWAQANNQPVRQTLEDGTEVELMRLDERGAPVYVATDNLRAAWSDGTARLWASGDLGFSLEGFGMDVGEWDGGAVLATHQEMTGRVTQVDGATSLSNHATHVGGTMIAGGADPMARGMAPQAQLLAYDWNSDDAEMATAAASGLLLSNHSYGFITGWRFNGGNGFWYWYGDVSISTTEDYRFGFYESQAQSWDQIMNNAPYYLILKSAGNDRSDAYSGGHYYINAGSWAYSTASRDPDGGLSGYDCIGGGGVAKNVLTVGAVEQLPGGYTNPGDVAMSTFSGWGPTDDGRIKPDVVNVGVDVYSAQATGTADYASYNGTSMSSPATTGSLLLLQEHYADLNAAFMRASTLKALVVHTADEAGPDDGPDYSHGWGMANAAKAALHISNDGGGHDIVEGTLTNGGTFTRTITSNGVDPVRITLAWNDPAGTPTAPALDPTTPMLVHDLDLRLSDASGTWEPWILDPANPSAAATTGDNFRDNVEQVYAGVLPAGTYTVTVSHKGTLSSSQDFGLIISRSDYPSLLPDCALSRISSFPYTQDFDHWPSNDASFGSCNGSDYTRNCWTNDPGSAAYWMARSVATTSSNTGPASDASGSGMYLYTEASSCFNTYLGLRSPIFDFSGISAPELRFQYHMWGSDMGTLSVEVSTDGGSSWSAPIWSLSGDQGNAWQSATVDLSAYGGSSSVMLRFSGTTGADFQSDIALDEVEIISNSCPAPSGLAVSNVQATQVDLSWSAGGSETAWNVEYGPAGFTLGSGTVVAAGSNPYLLTGLSVATSYEVYLQANCGGGDQSTWVGPVAFTTICGAAVAPWLETFDGSSTPSCWAESGAESWLFSTSAGWAAASAGDYTGNLGNYAWIDGSIPNGTGHTSTLTSIPVDVSALTNPELRFALFSHNNDDFVSYNTLTVEVYDGAAWQTVFTHQGDLGASWTLQSIWLGGLTFSGPAQVRFSIEENGTPSPFYNDLLIDNVELREGPTCPAPSNLTVQGVSNTQLLLDWTPGYSETAWNVAYGPVGFTPGTGTVVAATAHPFTLGGLSSSSSYDVYVQADCGGGDLSTWFGPVAATTAPNNYHYGGGPSGTDPMNLSSDGYRFANSTLLAAAAPDQPAYGFIDPFAGGHTEITTWTSGSDDDGYLLVPDIGFPFEFFGNTYQLNDVYVNTNGVLSFGAPQSSYLLGNNTPPAAGDGSNFIAACWMDLDDDTDGRIFYHSAGGQFIVTWWHYHDYADVNEYITVQLVLFSDGRFELRFNDAESTADDGVYTDILNDALIGAEDATETRGLAYRNDGLRGPLFSSPLAVGFYPASATTFPVELDRFAGEVQPGGNALSWQTLREENHWKFAVERSADGESFAPIGEVMGAGQAHQYAFFDAAPLPLSYYRLKQIDFDGTFRYSSVLRLQRQAHGLAGTLTAYPNPTEGQLTLRYDSPSAGPMTLRLYDLTGRLLRRSQHDLLRGRNQVDLDLADLPGGTYQLEVRTVNQRLRLPIQRQ